MECIGQTLSDTDSVYNGQVIPNLNSATQDGSTNSGMFLRGAPTSGTLQADATAVNGMIVSSNNAYSTSGGGYVGSGSQSAGGSSTITLSGDSETRPPNMTVVWIMRIK